MKIILSLLFFSLGCLSSKAQNADYLSHDKQQFIVDTITSNNFNGQRQIKIYLPKDYSKEDTYPVIYVLDAEWMFLPTVNETKLLSEFSVIPKSIVVGVFHEDRNKDLAIDWNTGQLDPTGLSFFKLLTNSIIPKIDAEYTTSGFNVLVGHSNSATYCHKILTQKNQPFSGFIALSQNLFGNQLQEFINFSTQNQERTKFYFVASGKRDATPRVVFGKKLDSLFSIHKNNTLKVKHTMYDADHMGIAARGINDGMAFIFSEFIHQNDWNDKLIDSLLAQNIDAIDYFNSYSEKMKTIYGINFKPNQDDLSFMQAMTRTDEEIKAVQEFEIKHFGKPEYFYAVYAQYYERIKSYDKALEYWNTHLEKYYQTFSSFFYFKRTIQLLSKKLNQPEKAIKFIEKWKPKAPRFKQDFNLKIAQIAVETNVEKQAGLKAIREYIEDYVDEKTGITLEKAKEIEQQLVNK